MKDKLLNSLKRRRKHKDRYERLSNESLEKRLAFNAAPVLIWNLLMETTMTEGIGFQIQG